MSLEEYLKANSSPTLPGFPETSFYSDNPYAFSIPPKKSVCNPFSQHDRFRQVWDLFFKDHTYLKKWKDSGDPPILFGSDLEKIFSDEMNSWDRLHIGLSCPSPSNPNSFLKSLKPHVMHTHGVGIGCYEYAFHAHNITLNLYSLWNSRDNGVYARRPEKLSTVGPEGRYSYNLVYGEGRLRKAKVHGLGENLESVDSVSKICRIQIDNTSQIIASVPIRFFKIDNRGGFVYGDDYSDDYQEWSSYALRTYFRHPQEECEACTLKGDVTFDI